MNAHSAGFGRRGASLSGSDTALSEAARQFIAQERAPVARESEIDFVIGGSDIQYVEIELDPGEAVIAENGAMIWKDSDIELTVRVGDGSDDNAGIMSKAGSAARNAISGESLFMTQFTHRGHGRKSRLALGGRTIGQIIPVKLDSVGGSLIARRGSLLAMAKGIELDARFQKRLAIGLIGGEGMIMQGLTGTGWAFLHVGGTLIEKELAAGDMISVDAGCVAAYQPSVDLSVGFVGGFGATICGNEGLLLSTLRGPGKVWIQTMPERLAGALNTEQPAQAGAVAGAVTGIAGGIAEGLVKKFF